MSESLRIQQFDRFKQVFKNEDAGIHSSKYLKARKEVKITTKLKTII